MQKVIIRSSTWQEEAEVDFKIKTIEFSEHFEYPLTLTNPDTREKEVYPIANTLLVQVLGESDEDQVSFVISESLLHEFEGKEEYDEDGNIIFELRPDRKIFELGMSIGLYFDYDELPKELKQFKIQTES